MKILLLGEFSSLHKYLKEGLLEIGNHEVTLASTGDGWKKIGGQNILLPTPQGSLYKRLNTLYVEPFKIVSKIKNYDVVQFIHPQIFSPLLNKTIFQHIKANNNVLSLVAAGSDYAFWKSYIDGRFEHSSFDYDKSMVDDYSPNKLKGIIKTMVEKNIIPQFDIIIPSLYEYAIGYENYHQRTSVIPFPINTDKIEYSENIVGDKIVFFHGLNNEAKKGTPFIREALIQLKKTYPNDVEVIIDGHMPFDKYLQVMNRSNVVIDQCCGYGYGINACISMAQGKVVVSGSHKETLDAFGISESPMVCAYPNSQYLFEKFEDILKHKSEIKEQGLQSRRYVEKLHNYKKVAQQYVDAWKSTGRL